VALFTEQHAAFKPETQTGYAFEEDASSRDLELPGPAHKIDWNNNCTQACLALKVRMSSSLVKPRQQNCVKLKHPVGVLDGALITPSQ